MNIKIKKIYLLNFKSCQKLLYRDISLLRWGDVSIENKIETPTLFDREIS